MVYDLASLYDPFNVLLMSEEVVDEAVIYS